MAKPPDKKSPAVTDPKRKVAYRRELRHSPKVTDMEDWKAVPPSSKGKLSPADKMRSSADELAKQRWHAKREAEEVVSLRGQYRNLLKHVVVLEEERKVLQASNFEKAEQIVALQEKTQEFEKRVGALEAENTALRTNIAHGLLDVEGERLQHDLLGPDADVRDFGKAFGRLREASKKLGSEVVRDAFQKYVDSIRELLVSQTGPSKGHLGSVEANRDFVLALNETLDLSNLRLKTPTGQVAKLKFTKPSGGAETGYFQFSLAVGGTESAADDQVDREQLPALQLIPRPARKS